MEIPKELGTFQEFGVDFSSNDGPEYKATCPFCGKKDHFFVNSEKLVFDCKRCGQSGSKSKFLELVYSDFLADTTDAQLTLYAVEKSIPLSTLKRWGLAYDKSKHRFLFPYWNIEGKFCDIRYRKIGEKPKSTKGCEVSLFGITDLLVESDASNLRPVCICGGESDTLLLDDILVGSDYKVDCVGLPGETTFKKNWITLFRDREVFFLLDNDEAGDKGHKKIGELLTGIAKSIQYVNWPASLPKGYDIRDYICQNLKSGKASNVIWTNIKRLCFPYRRTDTDTDKLQKTAANKATNTDSPPPYVNYETILKQFGEYMSLNENLETAIKLTLATVLSTGIPGPDPAWLFITGPPGSGKTTILSALKDVSKCYFQSTLRARSLISGFSNNNGFDPSILARIGNKCLVLKDFTEILGKPHVERDEIFSILRGAYDGEAELDFGNGQFRRYKCNFSVVAGVTDTIYAHSTAALGERFIKYRIKPTDDSVFDQQQAAMLYSLSGQKSKDSLRSFLSDFFRRDRSESILSLVSNVPPWFRESVRSITRLTAILRSTVERFNFGVQRDNPIYRPQLETGSRLAVQMQRLGLSLALVMEKDIDQDIYNVIKQVCKDTVFGFVFDIIKYLNQEGTLTSKQLAELVGLKQDSIEKYMDDLCILSLTEKFTTPSNVPGRIALPFYTCTQRVKDLWKTSMM